MVLPLVYDGRFCHCGQDIPTALVYTAPNVEGGINATGHSNHWRIVSGDSADDG